MTVRAALVIMTLSACTDDTFLLAQSDVFEATGWRSGPALLGARGGHTATLLHDGSLVVLGGVSLESDVSAQVCDLDANSCTARGALLQHFEQHDAALLGTGQILIGGGTWDARAEIYDPVTGDAQALPQEYCGAGSRLLALRDGRAFVYSLGSQNWLLDPRSSTWEPVKASSMTHDPATLAELNDGSILVSGACAICPGASRSAELLSPTGQWRTVAPMLTPRGGHTMSVLRDGRVLVVGGANREDPIGSELYDPVNNSWVAVGGADTNRLGHVTTLLDDGRVLVTGGKIQWLDPKQEPTWALFDPASASWTFGSDLRWRQYHAAVSLPGGRAVVIGGDRGYMDSRAAD